MSIKALDVDVTSNSMRNKSLLVVVLKYCLALRAQALRQFHLLFCLVSLSFQKRDQLVLQFQLSLQPVDRAILHRHLPVLFRYRLFSFQLLLLEQFEFLDAFPRGLFLLRLLGYFLFAAAARRKRRRRSLLSRLPIIIIIVDVVPGKVFFRARRKTSQIPPRTTPPRRHRNERDYPRVSSSDSSSFSSFVGLVVSPARRRFFFFFRVVLE